MSRQLLAAAIALAAGSAGAEMSWTPHVRDVADFILAQQAPQGCIPDVPGGLRAHEDGSMARSLIAVAYAARVTGRAAYRNACRESLRWLVAEMEKDGPWAGTWRHAYAAKPPHVALPTSPDGAAADARGVSATSALFVYLVALYTHTTGDETVSLACRPHVTAALDFLLERNRAPNGLFYRGWHQAKGKETWELCRQFRAMDQATVLLGLEAGAWLTGRPSYRLAANRLEQRIVQLFYDKKERAFGTVLDDKGQLLAPGDNTESLVTQGYLAWVLGPRRETGHAIDWLEARLAPDGTFRKKKTDPAAVLPIAAYCLGGSRVSSHFNDLRKARKLLCDVAVTPKGGVREMLDPASPIRNDLAGWVVCAWLAADPLPFTRPRDDSPAPGPGALKSDLAPAEPKGK